MQLTLFRAVVKEIVVKRTKQIIVDFLMALWFVFRPPPGSPEPILLLKKYINIYKYYNNIKLYNIII